VIFADKFFLRGRHVENRQAGILAPVPRLGRYLNFSLKAGVEPRKALIDMVEIADGNNVVVGIGQPTMLALGKTIANLKPFPTHFGAGLVLPSTSSALWCWLRGHDRGDLLHASNKIVEAVSSAFSLDGVIDAFNHGGGRDLTGYEDGTENPQGQKAIEAAIARGQGDGLDGSSFVAVQLWMHDFKAFQAMSSEDQDNAIGRRKSDNEELADAPESSHVKRTALRAASVCTAPLDALVRGSARRLELCRLRQIFRCFRRSTEADGRR
jgi:putative iron-dependent peroxidase